MLRIKKPRNTGQFSHLRKDIEQVVTVRQARVRPEEQCSTILRNCETLSRSRDPCDFEVPLIEPTVVFEEPHEYATKKPMNGSLSDCIVSESGKAFGGAFSSRSLNGGSVALVQLRFKLGLIGEPLPDCSFRSVKKLL